MKMGSPIVRGSILYFFLYAEATRSSTCGSSNCRAVPSTITASSPSSFVTVHAEFAARFCPLRDLRPVEKKNASSSHTPHTGITCGRLWLEWTVASQNVRQLFICFSTQLQDSRPSPSFAPTIPYPGANGRSALGCDLEVDSRRDGNDFLTRFFTKPT